MNQYLDNNVSICQTYTAQLLSFFLISTTGFLFPNCLDWLVNWNTPSFHIFSMWSEKWNVLTGMQDMKVVHAFRNDECCSTRRLNHYGNDTPWYVDWLKRHVFIGVSSIWEKSRLSNYYCSIITHVQNITFDSSQQESNVFILQYRCLVTIKYCHS